MNKVKCELKNCFGIENLSHTFDFSNGNVIAVYARNGLMKTSFAKTFKKIQEKQIDEIKDEIFSAPNSVCVEIDGISIKNSDVFVINSFESFYESENVTALLLNDRLKNSLNKVIKQKNTFLKKIEKLSGLKISKTSLGRKIFELEPVLVADFGFEEDSFLLNLKNLNNIELSFLCEDIRYTDIFDSTILKKITSDQFQTHVDNFCKVSDEIYSRYTFLDKGKFTLPKLKNLDKTLIKDSFFINDNTILLSGNKKISNPDDLKIVIDEIDNKLKSTPVFAAIEKLLSDSKGITLKDLIETKPEVIPYLKMDRLPDLKKQLWLSYLHKEEKSFKELLDEYLNLEQKLSEVDLDDTPWREALNTFEERFTVPYKMEISNMKGAIIGESIPRVVFSFERNGVEKKIDRKELEDIDILSQGEKRALYLLNIIFDIEQIKKENHEKLLIIDDIADSFDYKNKYAIIEYLYDMALENKFKIVILSHNFDFYRTVSSRLGLNRKNRFTAELQTNEIKLTEEVYQKQPFNHWKKNLNEINVLALIPFVRNLVEYGVDHCISTVDGYSDDLTFLTNLLHQKQKTNSITYQDLKKVYKAYLGNDNFTNVDCTNKIFDRLILTADGFSTNNVTLEYKIIISIAIRHIAEKFMKNEISAYTTDVTWQENRVEKTGSTNDFLTFVEIHANQTRELLNCYKQIGDRNKIKVLEEVNIMTPENIHINSFMYEPLLDMDINELLKLYRNVKSL